MPELMIKLENVQKEFRLRGNIIRALADVNIEIKLGTAFSASNDFATSIPSIATESRSSFINSRRPFNDYHV